MHRIDYDIHFAPRPSDYEYDLFAPDGTWIASAWSNHDADVVADEDWHRAVLASEPEEIPEPGAPNPDIDSTPDTQGPSPMYARLIQLRQILTDEEKRALAYAVLAATEPNEQQRSRWLSLRSWHTRDAVLRQQEIDSLRRLGHA